MKDLSLKSRSDVASFSFLVQCANGRMVPLIVLPQSNLRTPETAVRLVTPDGDVFMGQANGTYLCAATGERARAVDTRFAWPAPADRVIRLARLPRSG